MISPTPRVSALDIARAAADLQKATAELIRALTIQLREPTESQAEAVARLELRRDELHARLNALEEAYAAQRR